MSSLLLTTRNTWNILGLPFDYIGLNESADYVNHVIEQSQHSFISTPNLNFVIATQSDTQFFESVLDSDLSIADGMPLIWVAKILGIPITERVAGSSLFELLSSAQKEDNNKIRVFFFGGQKGVAEIAHQKLNQTSSGMVSCGYYDPGFVSVDDMSSAAIVDVINSTNPDFLVVALGAKKGQQWIQKNRTKLNTSVISHLGAVINFVAGHVERAPTLWQKLGLEWLWRIRQEPALWRRYFFDGLAFVKLLLLNVLPLALYDRWLKHTKDYHQPINLRISHKGGTLITVSGSVSYLELGPVKKLFSEVLKEGKQQNVELDCKQLKYIDGAFVATLLLFQRHINERGHQLTLLHVPGRIKRLLRLNNVLNRFQID